MVISTQHVESPLQDAIRNDLPPEVVRLVVPEELLDGTACHNMNQAGQFVQSGPLADVGLTGRKVVVYI